MTNSWSPFNFAQFEYPINRITNKKQLFLLTMVTTTLYRKKQFCVCFFNFSVSFRLKQTFFIFFGFLAIFRAFRKRNFKICVRSWGLEFYPVNNFEREAVSSVILFDRCHINYSSARRWRCERNSNELSRAIALSAASHFFNDSVTVAAGPGGMGRGWRGRPPPLELDKQKLCYITSQTYVQKTHWFV